MKSLIGVIIYIIALCILIVCCENGRVKVFGGTKTIILDKNTQFIHSEWSSFSLWISTTNRPDSIQPKTYIIEEHSITGKLNGKIIIKEQ